MPGELSELAAGGKLSSPSLRCHQGMDVIASRVRLTRGASPGRLARQRATQHSRLAHVPTRMAVLDRSPHGTHGKRYCGSSIRIIHTWNVMLCSRMQHVRHVCPITGIADDEGDLAKNGRTHQMHRADTATRLEHWLSKRSI